MRVLGGEGAHLQPSASIGFAAEPIVSAPLRARVRIWMEKRSFKEEVGGLVIRPDRVTGGSWKWGGGGGGVKDLGDERGGGDGKCGEWGILIESRGDGKER